MHGETVKHFRMFQCFYIIVRLEEIFIVFTAVDYYQNSSLQQIIE